MGGELLRLPLGTDAWAMLKAEVDSQVRKFEAWRVVSESTSAVEVRDTMRGLGLLKD